MGVHTVHLAEDTAIEGRLRDGDAYPTIWRKTQPLKEG